MNEITVADQTLRIDDGYTIGFTIKEETEHPKNADGSTDWSRRVPSGRYRFEVDMERVDEKKIAVFDYSKVKLPCGCVFEVGEGWANVETHDGYRFYHEFRRSGK